MEIEARYVEVSKDGINYESHSTILNYAWIDNELATLSKAKFFSKDYSPNCRFSDISDYTDNPDEMDMFCIDELADKTIYYDVTNPDQPSMTERPSLSTYSNLGRSKVITLLIDEGVSHVKFLDKSKMNEVIYEIEEKYVPFKKLFVVLGTALKDFNLIKSIHELSDHPHYGLDKDVVTIHNAVPGDLYSGLSDLRNGTVLGSSESNITIRE